MSGFTRRGLLAALVTAGSGGFLVGDTASAIAQAGQSGGTQFRTGRVRAFDGQQATVDIGGGTLLGMPYLRQYAPNVGDIVTCLGSNGVWVALGDTNAIPPDSAVSNGSFDNGLTGWTVYHDPSSTSTSTVSVTTTDDPVAGVNVAQVLQSSAAAGHIAKDLIYSAPIQVNVGDTWGATAYAYGFADFADPLVLVSLELSWYANSTNLYPTTSAADTVVDSLGLALAGNIWHRLRTFSGVTVPPGAAFMRVGFRSQLAPGAVAGNVGVIFDRITAQKI